MAVISGMTGCIEVSCEAHVGLARRAVVDAASQMGFSAPALDDLAIIVVELASNLVKHRTRHGRIEARPANDFLRQGIEIVSSDDGPGIPDPAMMENDGVSTRGTNGSGLGAIKRLTDSCEIMSARGSGTRVVCRKWLPLDSASAPAPMTVSVRTRCFPGESVCGDQYFVDQSAGVFTACVIDGCGHGRQAMQAATAALQSVKDNFKKPVSELFQRIHRACQGTRGVAMTFARIDLLRAVYAYAGVGNVALRIFTHNHSQAGVITPGTLGVVLRTVRVVEEAWRCGTTLCLYSDGLSDRWRNECTGELQALPVQAVSEHLLKGYARPDDDVTVLVAR
jgi:anti-sigma regulatory factor (Ser/Thr protein kinase)